MIRSPRHPKKIAVIGLFAIAFVSLDFAPATADEPPLPGAKWSVDDHDPESSVPPIAQIDQDPLAFANFVMELASKADEARKAGDHQASVKYHRALVKAVPDRSLPFSRLCEDYLALGDQARALESCKWAVSREGVTVNDFVELGKLLMAEPTLSEKNLEEVNDVITHLKNEPKAGTAGYELECKLGTKLEDEQRLESCTQALAQAAPDDPKTITYQWALAIKRHDIDEAWQQVERAKAAPFEALSLQHMIDATERAARPWLLWRWPLLLVAATLLVAAGGLYHILQRRSRVASV